MLNSWKQNLPEDLIAKVAKVDEKISGHLQKIDEQVLYNQQRLLSLFRKHRVAEEDLVGSTGYGFDDMGREKLEAIFADYFKVDDALVRPQLISGTHAIATAFYGVLRPKDTLYYMTGMPYDTIQQVIGVVGDNPKTLKEYDINFDYTPLNEQGKVDYDAVKEKLQNDKQNYEESIEGILELSSNLEKELQEIDITYATEKQKIISIDENIEKLQKRLARLKEEQANLEEQKEEASQNKANIEKEIEEITLSNDFKANRNHKRYKTNKQH